MITNPPHDAGLLSTILEAYNHHFNLRTGPDDWWYTIIQTIAVAIDKYANEENVRNFFVQHEGKKKLTVRTGPSIYGTDYGWFFNQMSEEIAKNIKVPEFVNKMESDFSTSNKIHKMVSKIVLMKSVEEYFEYRQYTFCGIPSVEMKGTREDWKSLIEKVEDLRELLEPIENDIGLGSEAYEVYGLKSWWERLLTVLKNLLNTYDGQPDTEWWSKIISKRSFGSGSPEFRGWFMVDVLNIIDAIGISSAPSGLVNVPMTITDGYNEENSTIVAGMVGYRLHKPTEKGKPHTMEPVHGWSLLLSPNSFFRNELNDWENKINGVEKK